MIKREESRVLWQTLVAIASACLAFVFYAEAQEATDTSGALRRNVSGSTVAVTNTPLQIYGTVTNNGSSLSVTNGLNVTNTVAVSGSFSGGPATNLLGTHFLGVSVTNTPIQIYGAVTNSGSSITVSNAVAVTQSGTWDEVGINDSGNSITVDAVNLDVQIGGSDSLTIGTFPDNEPFNLSQVGGQAISTGVPITNGATQLSVAVTNASLAVTGTFDVNGSTLSVTNQVNVSNSTNVGVVASVSLPVTGVVSQAGTWTVDLGATDNGVLDNIDADATTIIGHVDGLEALGISQTNLLTGATNLLVTIDADTSNISSDTDTLVTQTADLDANTDGIEGQLTSIQAALDFQTNGVLMASGVTANGAVYSNLVKSSAAKVYSINVGNTNGNQVLYGKVFNQASAVAVGGITPVYTFIVPGATNGAGNNVVFPNGGLALSSGFYLAITAGPATNDATAVTGVQVWGATYR